MIYVGLGLVGIIACAVLSVAWEEGSPRTRIMLAVGVLGTVVAATVGLVASCEVPDCKDVAMSTKYKSPQYWLVDEFGVGHRTDEALGRYAILLLIGGDPRGGAPFSGTSSALVDQRDLCTWHVAEAYRGEGALRDAKQSRWQPGIRTDTLVTHRRFGFVDGSESTSVAQYALDPERWEAIRGAAQTPCAICLRGDTPSDCPSLTLRDTQTNERPVGQCRETRRN